MGVWVEEEEKEGCGWVLGLGLGVVGVGVGVGVSVGCWMLDARCDVLKFYKTTHLATLAPTECLKSSL
jgi:hypothetical protein